MHTSFVSGGCGEPYGDSWPDQLHPKWRMDLSRIPGLRHGFCVFNIFSSLSDFPSQDKLTKWLEPKAEQFTKLQFFNDKVDQTPIFPNFNDYFCISLQIIYNYSAFCSSNFCISFNQERKSERIDRKLKTQIPNLSSSSQKVHMLHRAISRNRHYFSHKAQSTRNWKSHLGISCGICSETLEILILVSN